MGTGRLDTFRMQRFSSRFKVNGQNHVLNTRIL